MRSAIAAILRRAGRQRRIDQRAPRSSGVAQPPTQAPPLITSAFAATVAATAGVLAEPTVRSAGSKPNSPTVLASTGHRDHPSLPGLG